MTTPRPEGITEELEAKLLDTLHTRLMAQGVAKSQPYRNGLLRTLQVLFGQPYAESIRARALVRWQRERYATNTSALHPPVISPLTVTCPDCKGSGNVNSINGLCQSCGGRGYVRDLTVAPPVARFTPEES